MNKYIKILLLSIAVLCSGQVTAQQLQGRVIDDTTEDPIPGAIVKIVGSTLETTTDGNGYFIFTETIALGNQQVAFRANEYLSKIIPVVITLDGVVNLDPVYLRVDTLAQEMAVGIISLTENDLAEDQNASTNLSGLLQATRDQFLRAAAFDFSTTFFRPRGLDSEDGKVIINGIEMNKLFFGRPQFSNWGGLNDLQRNQVFTIGLAAAEETFGGYAGVQSINMRASQQRAGANISYAGANRSYEGRFMGTYNSGLMSNGWAYSVSASRRAGNEGFVDGTFYDANSLGLSLERKVNETHSINFTGMYTPNRRGRNTAITQEIRDLKGITYNPFWGLQDGQQRSSRVRDVNEPVFILSHYWDVTPKVKLNTNISYQLGKVGNTRIDNGGTTLIQIDGQDAFVGGARNPNPDYYQNLPSYHLRNGTDPIDFQNAFFAEREFRANGQVNWNNLYEGNRIVREQGGNAIYAIQEDRIDDKTIVANTLISAELTDKILFHGGINYRRLNSQNYAKLNDLLGGTGFLDIDFFAEESAQAISSAQILAQSDVRNPNRIVREGERYKYNFDLDAQVISSFAQAQFTSKKVDYFVAASVSNTTYQRDGKYENGNFLGNQSFGKSEKLDFTNYGLKGGATFKISGIQFIDVNAGYLNDAPNLGQAFANSRQTNLTVEGLESQLSYSGDVSYIYRSPIVKARFTAYYTEFQRGTDLGFYFTEDLTGLPSDDGAAFVQEVVTNIDRRNMGLEMGLEVQITPTINLKGAAAFGQNRFTNNPDLYLTSDDFAGPLRFGDGTTNLKGYHVAGGPETAMQIGFEYRDPDFWNIGVTVNYFANGYLDVNKLARSANFSQDFDGQTFNDYDPALAGQLLRQEQFNDYTLVNIVGGKSWRIDDKFVGFFATINNVFSQEFKTGGFEQARNSNFRSIRDDKSNPIEVFAPRYFFGNGATYYVNIYLRF